MQINDASLVEASVQLVNIIGKLNAVVLDDIRGTRNGGGSIVAVFGDFVTCTGNDKTTGGRDVKGVFAVTASTYHVDIAVGIEDGRNTRLQNAITETQQLVDRYTTHLQGGQQGGDLFVGVLALRDTNQYCFHLFTGQLLVVQHPVQDIFHCLCHIS